jgi:hypothetical protein
MASGADQEPLLLDELDTGALGLVGLEFNALDVDGPPADGFTAALPPLPQAARARTQATATAAGSVRRAGARGLGTFRIMFGRSNLGSGPHR